MASSPIDTQIVAVEYGGTPLLDFRHPKRAVYILGSEDAGLPPGLVTRAHHYVCIPVAPGRPASLNVAAAGAIVLWNRCIKNLGCYAGCGGGAGERRPNEIIKMEFGARDKRGGGGTGYADGGWVSVMVVHELPATVRYSCEEGNVLYDVNINSVVVVCSAMSP